MNLFSGTGVALVTPFTRDGSVDEVSLRNLVDYVIDGGVDYLLALGTTSEAATMTAEERARVMDIVIEQNHGRLPMVVGVGGNNTTEVVHELKTLPYVRKCDAVLSVVPYYNKPTQAGMLGHFSVIAEFSPIPVLLYNIPGRTGVNMQAETTCMLANKYPNVLGIKEASGNLQQVSDILKHKPESFNVISGDDGLALPMLAIGGAGVISVIANLFPKDFSDMMHFAMNGDFKSASLLHVSMCEWFKLLFAEGNPAGVKAALTAKGIISENILRLPLAPVSSDLYTKMKSLL